MDVIIGPLATLAWLIPIIVLLYMFVRNRLRRSRDPENPEGEADQP